MKHKFTLLLLLLSIASSSLFAQTFEVGGINYKITSTTTPLRVEVTQKTPKYTGSVSIPATVENGGKNYAVTSIGGFAFSYCYALTSVTIGNSVTSIGTSAFSSCSALTSVTIPNSVRSIGNGAFSDCSALTSVSIGNAVTSIGEEAFNSCSALTSVTIPNSVTSIGGFAFGSCTKLTEIKVDGGNTKYADIDGVLFNKDKTTLLQYPLGKTAITYSIPSSVTAIGRSAFRSCNALTSVTIGNSVTSIGVAAFHSCSALASVSIGNAVTSIGAWAFYNCSALASVTIGNSVTSIGAYAFSSCPKFTEIKVNGSNTKYADIDGVLFNKDKTTLLQYPMGKTATTYSIPNSVTSIGKNAFSECSALTSVTIPNSVSSIGGSAFSSCSALASIYSQISDLSKVTMGVNPFNGVNKSTCKLYVPTGTKTAYQAAGSWKDFTNIIEYTLVTGVSLDKQSHSLNIGESFTLTATVAPATATKKDVTWKSLSPNVASVDNTGKVTALKGGMASIVVSTQDGSYTDTCKLIVNTTEEVGKIVSFGKLFFKITQLSPNKEVEVCPELSVYPYYSDGNKPKGGVEIPASIQINSSAYAVKRIGEDAFYDCRALTSISIPNSVTSIGKNAFCQCFALTSVTIPNSVTSIGKNAFQSCNALTSVSIGNAVTSIGASAFSYCRALTTVSIPTSVTSIGEKAFSACTKLTEIKVEEGNSKYADIDGVLLNKDKTTLLQYPGGKTATTYSIPESVSSIGNSAFAECKTLTSLSIDKAVSSIGAAAFMFCEKLASVNIGNSVTSIGESAFSSSGIKSLKLPDQIKTVASWAFYSCESLESIDFGTALDTIQERVFFGCKALKSLTIPSNIKVIKKYAFSGSGLLSVNISEGLDSIGNNVFPYDLKLINLPKSLKTLGKLGSPNLEIISTAVEKPAEVKLGTDIFSTINFDVCRLVVPKGKKAAYKAAAQWKQFKQIQDSSDLNSLISISFAEKTKTISVDEVYQLTPVFFPKNTSNQVLFWESSDKKIATVSVKGLVEAKKKGSVVITATSAEGDKKARISIVVDEKVQIGKKFKVNNITYEVIESSPLAVSAIRGPEGTEIKNKKVTIPGEVTYQDTAYKVKEVGYDNNSFLWNESKLDTLVIEEGVEILNPKVVGFMPNLKEVYLPKSIKKIKESAFANSNAITKIVSKIEQPAKVLHKGGFSSNNYSNAVLEVPSGTNSLYYPDEAWRQFNNRIVKLDSFKFADDMITLGIGANYEKSFLRYPDDGHIGDHNITYTGVTDASIIFFEYQGDGDLRIEGKGKGEITITVKSDLLPGFESKIKVIVDDELLRFAKDGLYYIISKKDEPREVKLIKKWEASQALPSGEVVVPEQVEHAGKTYKVTGMGYWAFSGCVELTSIKLPNTIKYMEDYAFEGCKKLTTVSLPENLSMIAVRAFYACKSLKSLTIPNTVTKIGYGAFRGCEALAQLNLPNSLSEIEGSAFYACKSLKSLTIPNTVTKIGNSAFSGCEALAQLNLPNSLSEIENYAFSACKSLKSLTIPNTVTKIGNYAFGGCEALLKIELPKGVVEIGDWAFANCKALRSIKTNIEKPDEIVMGSAVFEDVPKETCRLYVPSQTKELYQALAQWKEFNRMMIGVEHISLSESSLRIKQGETATLVATILPADADNTHVLWKSSDNDVLTVSKGVLTAKKVGTASITATSDDGDLKATCEITVTPKDGINEEARNLEFSVYPSVVTNYFTIESKTAGNVLYIYNLMGKKVYEQLLQSKKEEINISHLQTGVYMLRINNEITKIVKE